MALQLATSAATEQLSALGCGCGGSARELFFVERTRVRVYLSQFAGERRLKREWVEWKKISCGHLLDFAS